MKQSQESAVRRRGPKPRRSTSFKTERATAPAIHQHTQSLPQAHLGVGCFTLFIASVPELHHRSAPTSPLQPRLRLRLVTGPPFLPEEADCCWRNLHGRFERLPRSTSTTATSTGLGENRTTQHKTHGSVCHAPSSRSREQCFQFDPTNRAAASQSASFDSRWPIL